MNGSRESDIVRISEGLREGKIDHIVIESPLSIQIIHDNIQYSMGLTMRTPGNDDSLVIGFLYSEGIIETSTDIQEINSAENEICIVLKKSVEFHPSLHTRQDLTTSACGVCGKESLSNLEKLDRTKLNNNFQLDSKQVSSNLNSMMSNQPLFKITGGSHAAIAFNQEGDIIASAEDVGRHNALDKLIGIMLVKGQIPMNEAIIHLSGRASYELVQKSIRAGFPILASVGASSSMAVELAREFNLTLISFLRTDSMVIHSAPTRIR